MTIQGELPPELRSHLERWSQILGLTEWEIGVHLVKRPGRRKTTTGLTQLRPEYLRASVRLMRRRTADQQRATAVHELLHVALGHLWQTVVRITEQLPADQQGHALARYSDAEEQTIERLRRALQAHLEDTDHGKQRTDEATTGAD